MNTRSMEQPALWPQATAILVMLFIASFLFY